MTVVSLGATFFVVWWIVLFSVLPWGVKTQGEEGEVVLGTVRSAPARTMLAKKAVATTVVALIVVFLIWLAIDIYGVDLEWIATRFDLRT